MTPNTGAEPKQEKPSGSLHQEAQLNIVRTSNLLVDAFDQLLKPYGITGTQYNVLRILRGAEPEGLSRNAVRDRLLSRMPDATRLLTRMEQAGLVTRTRAGEDRRHVTTRISDKGQRLVDALDDKVEKEHQRRIGQLSQKQVRKLIKLLTLVRETP
jgi:DNA-binding MarR family transcriptional regulator